MSLYVIGTVHTDLEGKKRLDHILKELSPNIIALEANLSFVKRFTEVEKFSEELETEFYKLSKDLGLRLNPEQKENFSKLSHIINSSYCYELRSALGYIKKNNNSRLEYIDTYREKEEERFQDEYASFLVSSFKSIFGEPVVRNRFLEELDKGIEQLITSLNIDNQEFYNKIKTIPESMKTIGSKDFMVKTKTLTKESTGILNAVFNPARDEAMSSRIRELYKPKERLVVIAGILHIYGIKSRLEDICPILLTLDEYNKIN